MTRGSAQRLVTLPAGCLIWSVAGVCAATAGAADGNHRDDATVSRRGVVVFQFDDGSVGHYTHAFRILEQYGIKGSFGIMPGRLDRAGALSPAQVTEMHRAGHEIHDHTLDHNAAFWGNPANRAAWVTQIEESLGILRRMGIETRGWNQPGGEGQAWTPELRETLARYYDYAAGRVALRPEQTGNIHWHLKDDPLSLGRGGVFSWGYNGGQGDPVRETECVRTRIADGLQQGLVSIPLWHVVKDEDGSASGLEAICRFVSENQLPTLRMADAVRAIRNPRQFFPRSIEQMPNPTFALDLDANGRPDGYNACRYAPAGVTAPGPGRAVTPDQGMSTWIYGPEPGRSEFSFAVRSTSPAARQVIPVLSFIEIDSHYAYRSPPPVRCVPASADADWSTHRVAVTVGPEVDRVRVDFEVDGPDQVYLASPSWRVVEGVRLER